MEFLLDTCTFLWIITDDNKLSRAASFWEIAVKYSLGKLPLPENKSTGNI
jgi:PIN domain nuclease of toxin-antitoxin system